MNINPVVCIGAALIDETFICHAEPIRATSNPAEFYRSSGGVSCNIAQHLALLEQRVELISCFGNDADAEWLMNGCRINGVGISNSLTGNFDTGRYVAVLSPSGELFVGAMSGPIDNALSVEFLKTKISLLKTASIIQLDCNLSAKSLNWMLTFCADENIPCVIEPVSIAKAARLQNADLKNVLLITPNNDELAAIVGGDSKQNTDSQIENILNRGVKYLWIRKGKIGSGIYSKESSKEIHALAVDIKDITGAGDAAMAGWIYAWLLGNDSENCVRYGHSLASVILQVKGAIDENLNKAILEDTFKKYIY